MEAQQSLDIKWILFKLMQLSKVNWNRCKNSSSFRSRAVFLFIIFQFFPPLMFRVSDSVLDIICDQCN